MGMGLAGLGLGVWVWEHLFCPDLFSSCFWKGEFVWVSLNPKPPTLYQPCASGFSFLSGSRANGPQPQTRKPSNPRSPKP